MGRLAKTGLVLAGYAAAVVAAVVAAWRYDVRVSTLPYDTSGGMYAGGQMVTALGVFLVVALVPTLYLVWSLRRRERFWKVAGILCLAFAVIGLVAVLLPLASHGRMDNVAFMLLGLVGLAQLLGVPLWAITFALFALLAPTRGTRRQILAALGIEVVIGVCAIVHWCTPSPPF
jgi:hypothetical protein